MATHIFTVVKIHGLDKFLEVSSSKIMVQTQAECTLWVGQSHRDQCKSVTPNFELVPLLVQCEKCLAAVLSTLSNLY